MQAITPYLIFNRNCREAMTFYQRCLGGELKITTYGEAEPKTAPEHKDEVIHAMLSNGPTVLLASDTMPNTPVIQGNDVWLNINCDAPAEVDKVFAALVAGGKPDQAPHDAFWGARFAMLTDKFGIHWMLNAQK